METQNITLALPKEVLHRARQMAVERHTSLSALLAQMVMDLVQQEDRYRAASVRQLALMAQGLDLGTHGNASWSRDELHER
jgi:hypothetical protein